MTAEQVLAAAAAVVDQAPIPVILCDVMPAPGVWCGMPARHSITCLCCGSQLFLCSGHRVVTRLDEAEGMGPSWYEAVIG